MLPGFRFLFAAIMLSMSLLIFGLGAAALFRAAHESFASNSSWRATPDVSFAQRPDSTLPVLATLRIEPLTAKLADTPKVAAAPAGPAEAITEPMTSARLAALPRVDTPPAEIARPDDTPAAAPLAENPPGPEAAPVSTEAATAGETRTAAVAVSDAASAKSEPAAPLTTNSPAAPPTASAEPAASVASIASAAPTLAAPSPEVDNAAAKIATLGGPPVEVTDSESVPEMGIVKIPRARPDESAIKKRQQARRAARRRRLAARARLLALQQLQANPFTQLPFAQQPFAQAQQNFASATARQAAPRQ
jgi:hypothetical protein